MKVENRAYSQPRPDGVKQAPRVYEGEPFPSDMPHELRGEFVDLEQWAQKNQIDERRSIFGFWALKVPAILASISAGAVANFQLPKVGICLGLIGGFCVAIDAYTNFGQLKNVYLRAFNDIRRLQQHMKQQWRLSRLRDKSGDPNILAATILEQAENERRRISAYIREATTMVSKSEAFAPHTETQADPKEAPKKRSHGEGNRVG